MSNIHIRLIENPADAHIDAAVKILARAFKDEHIVQSATGGNFDLFEPYFRSRLEEAKFNGRLYLAVSQDEVNGVEAKSEEQIVGAAYWTIFEPSKPTPESVKQLISDYDAKLDARVRDWWYSQWVPTMGTLLSPYSAERVWLLRYLGVLPEFRQKGIGKVLVLSLKDEVKPDGWNFSLITRTLENVKFYESLGFRTARNTVITDGPLGDVPVYVMIDGFANQ